MAKKIFKGATGLAGSLLGKSKKKAADVAAPVDGKPITAPLDTAETLKRKKLNRQPLGGASVSSILSDTLGA